MKTMILITTLLTGTLAQAQVSKLKSYLPSGIYAGDEGTDYRCQVKATWISDNELSIEGTNQYKDSAPKTDTMLFSDVKKAEFGIAELNETDNEVYLSQSTLLFAEDEYEVHLYEQLILEMVDGRHLESVAIGIDEVDNENDPHESGFTCRNLKKIK